jgi:hypothetical protein
MEQTMSLAEPTDPPKADRRGWRLVGLLLAHVGLGVVTLAIGMAALVDKYLFCDTPPLLGDAAWTAFGGWLAAGAVVIGIWSSGRRLAWTVSLLWAAVSVTALLAITAIEPATNCNIAF